MCHSWCFVTDQSCIFYSGLSSDEVWEAEKNTGGKITYNQWKSMSKGSKTILKKVFFWKSYFVFSAGLGQEVVTNLSPTCFMNLFLCLCLLETVIDENSWYAGDKNNVDF